VRRQRPGWTPSPARLGGMRRPPGRSRWLAAAGAGPVEAAASSAGAVARCGGTEGGGREVDGRGGRLE
jgi:hypothetical protein